MALVKVTLWDRLVGAIAWDSRRNSAVFEFSESFAHENLDIAPLLMPHESILRGQRTFSFPELSHNTYEGLPGLLADSLPDAFGNAVLRAWLRNQNREASSLTPLEKLSYVGSRGMGALEFEPSTPTPEPQQVLEVERLLDLTNKVLEQKNDVNLNLNSDEQQTMADLIRVGASAGGQRPKALIAYNEETGEIKSGQLKFGPEFQYYLLKFDGVNAGNLGDPLGYGRSEYAYSIMAKQCQINMTPCRLLEENGRAHFMTQRFDRDENGGKIHMQTLCAMAHFDFNMAGMYDYNDAFEEMRALNVSYADMEQLYRRMVFNVVARNQDDHTKNISFVMNRDGQWRLSPAYDVTWSYNPHGQWTNVHQMSILGKRDNITKEDLITCGVQNSIKKPDLIVEEVKDVVSAWEQIALECEVPGTLIKQVKDSHRLLL